MNDISKRMKEYEYVTRYSLTKRIPVIVRLDGQAFHTYTKGMDRPFDQSLINRMLNSAVFVASKMQGFKLGYVQSDEASFLFSDFDSIETESWFNNNLSKIISISASMMTAAFNVTSNIAFFDSRAFNMPSDDVPNYFLWRAFDWQRNSLQMYCQSFFSQEQLNGKNKEAMHKMLSEIGQDWNGLSDQIKYGSWIRNMENGIKVTHESNLSYDEIKSLI